MSSVPLTFQHPFTMVVSGPTMCGKTHWVHELIVRSNKIDPPPERVVWVYSEWQPSYDVLQKHFGNRIEFVKGWTAEVYEKFHSSERNLLVLDDVMTSSKNDSKLSDLFTKGASHRNLSVILIIQNLFFQGRSAVDVRRNSQYTVLFKCRQDKRQLAQYAQQIFPDNIKFMTEAFADATAEPHGHLLVDLKPNCPDEYTLRSNVLGESVVVYMTPENANFIYNSGST